MRHICSAWNFCIVLHKVKHPSIALIWAKITWSSPFFCGWEAWILKSNQRNCSSYFWPIKYMLPQARGHLAHRLSKGLSQHHQRPGVCRSPCGEQSRGSTWGWLDWKEETIPTFLGVSLPKMGLGCKRGHWYSQSLHPDLKRRYFSSHTFNILLSIPAWMIGPSSSLVTFTCALLSFFIQITSVDPFVLVVAIASRFELLWLSGIVC